MTSATADRLANWAAGLAALVSAGAIAGTVIVSGRPAAAAPSLQWPKLRVRHLNLPYAWPASKSDQEKRERKCFNPNAPNTAKRTKGRIHGRRQRRFPPQLRRLWPQGPRAQPRHRASDRSRAPRLITRAMKRQGAVCGSSIFPDVPVSKKPVEVRMGSGKGTPEFWVCPRVHAGRRIMFEMDGVPMAVAKEAFELAAAKLPIKIRFVQREAAI